MAIPKFLEMKVLEAKQETFDVKTLKFDLDRKVHRILINLKT